MSAQYQIIINKSMEQSFVSCIQQTVKVLAENYEFDYEEAIALFGSDDLKVETNLGKTKGVKAVGSAPKRTKPKFPLPFTGEVFDDCCRAIVFNSGLFTQCLKEPKPDSQKSLCQTCEKQAEKTPLGVPPLGYISDRLDRGDDWADPKGRRPVPYTKVMKAKKFTQEEVMAEVSQYDMTLDLSVFDDTDSEKRGRKKGGKKTEVQSIFGDDEDDDLLGALIQEVKDSESEVSEKSKTSKSSKKSKEEREAEKLEKASQKSENDLMKAEEKRMRELKKDEDRIAKEHEKRAKEQQKEALRLLKEAKEEEKRLAKEAKEQEKKEKEAAKEAAKAAKEAAKADEKRSPVKNIKEDKMRQPEVVKEVEVEKEVEQLEELEEVEQLEELEEVEQLEEEEVEPGSPLDPPPVEEPVVEEEEVVIPIQAVKPKMRKFKGPNGVSYVADPENIVYRKDAPTVRVGVLTPDGLELDEEEEEDLSDIE